MPKKLVLLIAILLLITPGLAFNVRTMKNAGANTSNSIIQNGGFEQGLTGWADAGDGFLAVSADNPHSGNYSLEISSSVTQQAYFYQFVDMPNASFMFSFWLFRVDAKSWTACYLGRDWDGNTIRVVSSLVIDDDTIELNAWDNPYAPGRQVFNYDVTVGSWHNMTFLANATLGTQDFYIDGNLVENLNSSSGNVFSPDVLIFGDVNTVDCHGHFYFDDFELNGLGITLSILPYVFSVESNSTISNLNFDAQNTTLSFEVSGTEGTIGYVRVTLAKTLVPDISKLKIQVDGSNYNYTYQETDVSWLVTFTYTHSVHQVYMNLGQIAVEEFSPYAFSLMIVTVGALLALLGKRRVSKRKCELNSVFARAWVFNP